MKAVIFTVCVLFALTWADPVQFKDCGSKLGSIVSLDIDPCPKLPCQFKKGTNVTATMVFKASADISTAATVVYGYLEGKIKAPFPLPDNNACHNMNCPIKNGDTVTYKNAIAVQEIYPSISLIVQWQLMSGSDMITCFTIPAQVVA